MIAPLRSLAVLTLAAGLLSLPAPARAEDDRTLSWRLLDVDANLDAAGDLHLVERQVMLMTGAWNGGERRFRVGPGQVLELEGVWREVSPGLARPLATGDLDEVDQYRLTDETTLRWRSRRPTDPPYAGTELTYVLRYTIHHVLVASEGGGFRLGHDFAFPDRPGAIARVTARLTVDPAWQVELPEGGALALDVRDLSPGQGAVLTVPLRWVGAGPAPEANQPPPPPEPPPEFPLGLHNPLLAALGAVLLAAWIWLQRDARARGLTGPLPGPVDEAWLTRNLWALPPEVVGAAWDDEVGSPEVSAVLARMTAEGKLAVSVTSSFLGLLKVVHLRLLVKRDTLQEHERRLVDGLFVAGDETDSNVLRRHYAGRGFDPATRIESELDAKVRQLHQREAGEGPEGPSTRPPRWNRLTAAALALGGFALCLLGVARNEHPVLAVGRLLVGVLLTVVALAVAGRLAVAVDGRGALLALAAAPLLVWLGMVDLLAAGMGLDGFSAGLFVVLAHALVWCAAVVAVAGAARSRLYAAQVRVRRRLLAARRYLAAELARPAPRLKDEAIPYLLALGLGRGLDRWLKVHGAVATSALGASSTFRDAASSSAAASGGGWTGGGGAFSGGGASGSWAALASVASGVPAPTSSSSGGSSSSSSSSSSGGGGGGGW